MKTKVMSLIVLFMLSVFTVFAEDKTEKLEVKGGDCVECKKHIEESALSVEGVSMANWNAETKQLEVIFDDAKITLDDVEKAIAKGGNDTPKQKADDEAYNNLPECCKYERE
jgi:copper chaperone CopZ